MGNSDPPVLGNELDLASELFHRINRVIPEDQKLLMVPPSCLVRDAVALMREHGYSQLPVVQNAEVLGVFSYRSFAIEAATVNLDDLIKQRCALGDLCVAEFLERFEYARVTEEMSHVFDAMDRDNGVLIGTPGRLIAVLTAMDFLRYFYQVASPFLLISEIELALRALIKVVLNEEQIQVAAQRSLKSAYGGEDKVPQTLEEMTFDNHQSLIAHGENWDQLDTVFGGTRIRVSGKLKEVGEIRNALFHFRRKISVQEHEVLVDRRNWLLNKIRQAQCSIKRK